MRKNIRVSLSVNKGVWDDFRNKCIKENTSMSEKVCLLIEEDRKEKNVG